MLRLVAYAICDGLLEALEILLNVSLLLQNEHLGDGEQVYVYFPFYFSQFPRSVKILPLSSANLVVAWKRDGRWFATKLAAKLGRRSISDPQKNYNQRC